MILNDKKQKAQAIEDKLDALIDKKITELKNRSGKNALSLKHLTPDSLIEQKRQKAEALRIKLDSSFDGYLRDAKHRMALLIERYKAKSPLDRLGGGYVYASNESGKALRSAKELIEGERVRLRFKDGAADARIEKVEHGGAV